MTENDFGAQYSVSAVPWWYFDRNRDYPTHRAASGLDTPKQTKAMYNVVREKKQEETNWTCDMFFSR